jgi:hypothetical protein
MSAGLAETGQEPALGAGSTLKHSNVTLERPSAATEGA